MRMPLLAVALVAQGAFAQNIFLAQNKVFSNKLAPYVASPQRVIDRMLELAAPKPSDVLFDLGCGDGRILIAAVQKFRVKAVGVEISEKLASTATENIHRAGLDEQAKVIQGDLLDVDLSKADVVTIYLMTQANEKLRPRLEKQLKPGARVVSIDYAVPGWKPSKIDKSEESRGHLIYLYEMPPAKQ